MQTSEYIHKNLIGKSVVVRSSPSGVWVGKLVAYETSTELAKVGLENARRVWSWEGAASCAGLASHGPSGGKITAPVERVVVESVCETNECTRAALERFGAVKEWVADE
jgi:hypothetical protein